MQRYVGIDASQLYPSSRCQPMPTGFYKRWVLDTETRRVIPRQSKTRSFETVVMSYCQRMRLRFKNESCSTTGRQKKPTASMLMGFSLFATLSMK